MYKRQGENISCLEVEDSINSHPYVLEASVYGIPDERLGEILCCSLTIQDKKEIKEEDIKDYLKNHLAGFKIPTFFDFHKKQLPRTASGKIYKLQLRKEMEKRF